MSSGYKVIHKSLVIHTEIYNLYVKVIWANRAHNWFDCDFINLINLLALNLFVQNQRKKNQLNTAVSSILIKSKIMLSKYCR